MSDSLASSRKLGYKFGRLVQQTRQNIIDILEPTKNVSDTVADALESFDRLVELLEEELFVVPETAARAEQ